MTGVFIIASIGIAQAYLIDFTTFVDANNANNMASYTETDVLPSVIDDLDLTFTAMKFVNQGSNPYAHVSISEKPLLYWDDKDGFGLTDPSYEADEIENPEYLRLDFSKSVYVSEVYLTDLFNEPLEGYRSGYFLEQGAYSLNGGSDWNYF